MAALKGRRLRDRARRVRRHLGPERLGQVDARPPALDAAASGRRHGHRLRLRRLQGHQGGRADPPRRRPQTLHADAAAWRRATGAAGGRPPGREEGPAEPCWRRSPVEAPFRLRIVGDGPRAAPSSARSPPPGCTSVPRSTARSPTVSSPTRTPVPTWSSSRRFRTPGATATGCPMSCSRRWRARDRWWRARWRRFRRRSVTGKPACLAPPGDPRALRAALERLASDPALRAGMGVAARTRVERDFELGRCTRRLLDCLRDAYA